MANTWQRLMRLQQAALIQLVREVGPVGEPPRSAECRRSRRSFDRLVRERLRLDRRPLLAALSDKVLLRRYGEARGGLPAEVRPPELLFAGFGSSDCARLPRVSSLPRDYVFKASHRSACVLLVINGSVAAQKPCNNAPAWLRGANVTQALLRTLCTRWLSKADNSFPSSQLTPGVLFEALLPGPARAAPAQLVAADAGSASVGKQLAEDVKCWTFGGQTMLVQQASPRAAVVK